MPCRAPRRRARTRGSRAATDESCRSACISGPPRVLLFSVVANHYAGSSPLSRPDASPTRRSDGCHSPLERALREETPADRRLPRPAPSPAPRRGPCPTSPRPRSSRRCWRAASVRGCSTPTSVVLAPGQPKPLPTVYVGGHPPGARGSGGSRSIPGLRPPESMSSSTDERMPPGLTLSSPTKSRTGARERLWGLGTGNGRRGHPGPAHRERGQPEQSCRRVALASRRRAPSPTPDAPRTIGTLTREDSLAAGGFSSSTC